MGIKKILLGTFSLKRLLVSSVLIYIIMNFWIHYISDSLMFPYNQTSYNDTLSGLDFIEAKDGTKIAIRFWKSSNEQNLVLYFHGNYLDLGYLDGFAEKLNTFGYSVLAMDYRGYGLSQGFASENNTYHDSQLLYDKAIDMGYSDSQILIIGRSIGTGIATELALRNKSKVLILISPFVSAYRVMTKIQLLPFDKFTNLDKISQVSEPLFIIHGSKDSIIEPWHSEVIVQQHKGPNQMYLIDGAGHNDIFDYDLDEILSQLHMFLDNS